MHFTYYGDLGRENQEADDGQKSWFRAFFRGCPEIGTRTAVQTVSNPFGFPKWPVSLGFLAVWGLPVGWSICLKQIFGTASQGDGLEGASLREEKQYKYRRVRTKRSLRTMAGVARQGESSKSLVANSFGRSPAPRTYTRPDSAVA